MPLFNWMKWSQVTKVKTQDETPSVSSLEVMPGWMLIPELLWHEEERARLAREMEREHRLAHCALGLHWFQIYHRLRNLLPPSELLHLEFLCAQIPPIHAPAVLSRVHQVLTSNNIRPWELALIFKQVLIDFLSQTDYEEIESWDKPKQFKPMEGCTSRYKTKQSIIKPTIPVSEERVREEIPTISGYVDRLARLSTPSTSYWSWEFPYLYQTPLRCKGANSRSL